MGIFSAPHRSGGDTVVKLLQGEKTLFEVSARDFVRNIVIGRSSDCDWPLDRIDDSVSSKHAELSMRNGRFLLKDLGSRNGMLCQGRKIAERRLSPGDRVSLGGCTLSVESTARSAAPAEEIRYSLEYADDKNRRCRFRLAGKRAVLGSLRGDLVLSWGQLVSGRHAEISVRPDGSAWLHDLNSRNGTFVNGERLAPGNERILRSGDEISLADINLRFFANSGATGRNRTREVVATVAVTLLLGLAAYVVYMFVTPDAQQKIGEARAAAEAGDFETARIRLDEMGWSRDAESRRNEMEKLLGDIDLWQRTFSRWQEVIQALEKKNWVKASQLVGSLQQDNYQAWNWNARGAVGDRQAALAVRTVLECCSKIDALGKGDRIDLPAALEARRTLSAALAVNGRLGRERAFLLPLGEYGGERLATADAYIAAAQELDSVAEMLRNDAPDYPAAANRLKPLAAVRFPAIRQNAERLDFTVAGLREAAAGLERMRRLLFDMRFAEVEAVKIELPAGADSAESGFLKQRNAVSAREKMLKDAAKQLNACFLGLESSGADDALFAPFEDRRTLDAVLSCDSLAKPLPRRLRTTPSGLYDRIAGIEFLYDYLAGLETQSFRWNAADGAFVPLIDETRRKCAEIDRVLAIVGRPENAWYHSGKLGVRIDRLEALKNRRAATVNALIALAETKSGRERLIALGMAGCLLGERGDDALNRRLLGEFQVYARRMRELRREFAAAPPQKAIEIRKLILETGLPGDPVVQGVWKDLPRSGGEQP